MEEIWVYKNKLLPLLPCTNIKNNGEHVHIHTTTSSHDLSNLIGVTGQLYLELVEKAKDFSLIQEATLKGSNAVVLAKIPKLSIDKCVEVCADYPKQFKLAGIDVFYKIESNGRLTLEFHVNTEKLVDSVERAKDVLSELCRNNVASTINEFFDKKTPKLSPKFEHFCAIYSTPSDTSSSNFQPFFDEVEKHTTQWNVAEDYEIQDKYLNCQLMQYQRKTVKWMIERELKPETVDLTSLLYCVQFANIFYYPVLGIFSKSKIFDSIRAPKGGILADEMGLGKTVEILALIVSNQKDKNANKDSNVKTTQKHLDWSEYKSAKTGKMKSAAVYTATTNADNVNVIKCKKCGDLCSMERSGWKVEFETDDDDFWCPQCMATKTPLEVKTTLIVLPETLIVQWYNEIVKHCSEDLKVMFYYGLKANGYLHPREIAKYDIILVPYATLAAEFQFSDFRNASGRPRWAKCHKFSPTSINHVKWWRAISDESQLIEGALSKAAKMCCTIAAHNRWAMTGTPIVHTVADLGGLFRNIALWPMSVEQFWDEHIVAEYHQMSKTRRGDVSRSRLVRIAAQVVRRNTKRTVGDEMRIPKLVEMDRFVEFPRIEESQYRKEMERLKRDVADTIVHADDDLLLKEMAGKDRVLVALGKLKETLISCGEHTNLSKSKNVNDAVISDPKNVIFRLIRSKKIEIGDKFRSLLNTLILLSEGNWLVKDMTKVLNRYEKMSEIMLMIEELNKFFERVMGSENEEDEDDVENNEPTLKTAENVDVLRKDNRKRNNEEVVDSSPPKIAKLEVQPDQVKMKAEKKAREAMREMRKAAMRPILPDPIMSIRFIEGLGKLGEHVNTQKTSKKIMEAFGGQVKAEKRKNDAYERCMSKTRKFLEEARHDFTAHLAEWPSSGGGEEMFHGMLEHLKKIGESYRQTPQQGTTTSMVDGFLRDFKFTEALKELPFWPVFSTSEQHLEDGKLQATGALHNGYWRTQKHQPSECMGVCNGLCLEVVAKNYQKSTNIEFVKKLRAFIQQLEVLRDATFRGCETLIRVALHEDGGNRHNNNIASHRHKHSVCDGDQTRLVMSRAVELKCEVCAVLRTLAQLRFAVGCGSFHGQTRATSRTGIEDLFAVVVLAERKRDTRLDGSDELRVFNRYIARLRQSAHRIQTFCDIVIEHINERRKVEHARHRLTVADFRPIYDPHNRKSDALVKQTAIRERPGMDGDLASLEAECQQLRYLVNVYDKEREVLSGKSNNEREEGRDCPICLMDMEVFSIFPCGHRVCDNCYRRLCDRSERLSCVTCRKNFDEFDVIDGRERMRSVETGNIAEVAVPGLKLSAKLDATIRLMREILQNDPLNNNNKIILFTTLDYRKPIWRFLTMVLQKAELPFVEVTYANYGKSVSSFELSADVKIFLCPLSLCANGLNLTRANTIIFLDPPHLFSVVEQAIGRISRYGQKQDMRVYHMIVRESIDEEIRKIVKSAKNEDKEDNDLTIGELRQIFGINRNNS